MKKRLAVLVLAFAMVLTMSASVFAGTGTGANSGRADSNTAGKDYTASEAKLVKYVTAAEGVTLPNETFTFTFTPKDIPAADVKDYTVPKASHPTGKTATIATSALTETPANSGKWVGSVAIADIFKQGLTTDDPAGDFPRAGEYTFDVEETAGSTTGMTYSKDKYVLRLVVDRDGNIDDVTVQNKDGQKVEADDDNPTDNSPAATPAASNGGFTFTNNYEKLIDQHSEPNPNYDPTQSEDPDTNPKTITSPHNGALKVEKLVEGQYGDLTKGWEFNVAVTLPTNTVVKSATNPDGYDLTANTPATTTIKSGESFVYQVLPAGSKITITEIAANQAHYTTTFEGTKAAVANGTEFVLSEDGQFVKVTNEFDDTSITPTGIIINNLPYVLLIGIALGGIVLFSRKRRYE